MDNPSTTVVGLDVSDRWTHVFRTERGCPDRGERSKIRTRKSPMKEYFRSLPPVSTIILEVGPHSRWIYHVVLSCGMGHDGAECHDLQHESVEYSTTSAGRSTRSDGSGRAPVARLRESCSSP